MTFKIEKNVPAPARKRNTKYPFSEMEVGDSFVASLRAASAARVFGKVHGKWFTARSVGDGKVRIWRLE